MDKVIAVFITLLFVLLIFWTIFKLIKKNQLPKRNNYTPFDDIMSGKKQQGVPEQSNESTRRLERD